MNASVDELGTRLRELLKTVRSVRQHYEGPVPLGMVGMLAEIDNLSTVCHARELAARSGLDPSTVSRTVAALVVHGLVERRLDPTDKRASFLAITPAGRAALAETQSWYGEVLDQALTGWTRAEVTALCAALARFTHDLDATVDHDTLLEAAR